MSGKSWEAEPWEVSGSCLEIVSPAVIHRFKMTNKANFFFFFPHKINGILGISCSFLLLLCHFLQSGKPRFTVFLLKFPFP